MFAVPEVDDDTTASSPTVETTKLATQLEAKTEILSTVPSHPPPTSTSETPVTIATSTENNEKNSIKTAEVQFVPSPASNRQHLSRISQFQRNTIHVCDQISDHITPHQQHHSAPPTHHQTSKTGLDAINEHGEYPSNNEQQQLNSTTTSLATRFPRSSTVPYPACATVRQTTGNSPALYPCYYSDNGAFIHGTVSPAQLNAYYHSRQPLSIINTNFQPISPHHYPYNSRPVDVLKPTFLIVPKSAEQQLSAQLSTSNSPTPSTHSKTSPTKSMTKKTDLKTSTTVTQSPPASHRTEIRNSSQSPPRMATVDTSSRHTGLMATPNPSPYVHYVNKPCPIETSQEVLPETSVIQENFTTSNEYNQTSASIRSMPNIPLTQVSPYHLYGSPNLRYYRVAQQLPPDEQQVNGYNELMNVRPAITTQMVPTTSNRRRIETGETDESSVQSLDFAHTDLVEIPGSWRYQSVPYRAMPRRIRPPIPQAFLDQQHYASDSEQVVRPASYRQQQMFGSIPTINQPFDSIRVGAPIQFSPAFRLEEKDTLKIASFYRSMGTLIYVARSLATLYTSDFDAMANLKDWKKLYTGVPIWLFNTGMNPKRARCIRLVISEFGSSFTLWDTIVNGASDVRLPKPRHITLKSLETGTILALKFDETTATDEFHQYFVKLSCDPRNADLFDVFNAKRRRPVFILRKKKIKKSAISKPSQFAHITKVDENDRDSLYTFSVLVDEGPIPSS